ncbi:hypothetical protein [Hymenobacter sp. GOD-10R]|uniref:hypothetical protein n=1 Tax=Hymenobacter sp. GOD-10R TaxID=3093922 RepID=UPI002D767ACF|nr:hypothetical protein [Hymenobacter sp. GOD-10R]WRQ31653.1 hypothetical protein SD425_27865 [Hymenobacter sp. GOD-10R]
MNVLLRRNGLFQETLSFWGHLLLTIAWLTLFYKAGASEWVGWRISGIPQVTSLFYRSQKLMTWAVRIITGLLLVLLAYQLYATLLAFAEGGALPRGQVLSVLLLVTLLLLTWHVRYINPQQLYATGLIPGRDRPLWVSTTPAQIVYMAEFTNGNQLWVRQPTGFVDISYRDVYAFDANSLSHKLFSASTAQSVLGDIRYNLTLWPVFDNFPTHLTASQLYDLQARLSADVDITTEISVALDRLTLINSVTSRYLNAVSDVYTKSGTSIFDDVNREVFSNFDKLKASIDFGGLEEDCQARIRHHLSRFTGVDNAFEVAEFIITDVQFSDGEIQRMLNDIRERAKEIAKGRRKMEEELAGATIVDGGQPGVNVGKRAEDRLKGLGILRSSFSTYKQEPKVLSPAEQQAQFQQTVRQDSSKVLDVLLDPRHKQLGPDAINKSLLVATSLFADCNISPESFVHRFLQKIDGKEEQPEEAWRQVIEETLFELFYKAA